MAVWWPVVENDTYNWEEKIKHLPTTFTADSEELR